MANADPHQPDKRRKECKRLTSTADIYWSATGEFGQRRFPGGHWALWDVS